VGDALALIQIVRARPVPPVVVCCVATPDYRLLRATNYYV
jgi:hypothetical protein